MFGSFNRGDISKLDVLESKLSMYEKLSREMLERLEIAVEKISQSNNNIANILAKHDERIDQSMKSDALIMKLIEDGKKEFSSENNRILKRIESVEKKAEEFTRVKWLASGIGAFVAVFATVMGSLASGWLTPPHESGIINHTYSIVPDKPINTTK